MPRQCAGMDIGKMEWDFTSAVEAEDHPFYRTYGDSLVAEIHGGLRLWYELRSDSAFYMGEETRHYRSFPDIPIPTTSFTSLAMETSDSLRGAGLYCRTLAVDVRGSYESFWPVEGRMILDNDLSVKARAIIEKRASLSEIRSDTIPGLLMVERESTRTRWYLDGDPIPVAMQLTETTRQDDQEVSSESGTYVMDMDELMKLVGLRADEKQRALDEAEITVFRGTVTVRGCFPEGTVLVISVSDLEGMTLHCDPAPDTSDNGFFEFSLPHLPHGRYVLTVSAGTPSDRKLLINL